MSGRILVSGFDRFGPLKRPNPSSEVILSVLEAERPDITQTIILPTVFDSAAKELLAAAKEVSPLAIVMFGLASSLDPIRLERQARNARFSPIPDNAGQFKFGRITGSGPQVLASSLPLQTILTELRDRAVPVRLSNSAGRFVCNDVFYQTMLAEQAGGELPAIPTGFIHLGTRLSDVTLRAAALSIIDTVSSYTTD